MREAAITGLYSFLAINVVYGFMPYNQPNPAFFQPAVAPAPYYDPDLRMSCTFGAISPAGAPIGPRAMGPRLIDVELVADQVDTIQDMRHVPGVHHSIPRPMRPSQIGRHHHQRPRPHSHIHPPAAAHVIPAIAPAAAPAPATGAAPAARGPQRATGSTAAPRPAARVRQRARQRARPVIPQPAPAVYYDYNNVGIFGGMDMYGLGGIVKRQVGPIAGHPSTCRCVPTNDISGDVVRAFRAGRPMPFSEEMMNPMGKCPVGRSCVCPNLNRI